MAFAMGWRKPDNVAGSSAPAIMIGIFVASGGLLFGYDTGTINGILAMSAFKEQFSTGYVRNGHPSISPSQTAIIVAILSAGTVVGALIAAPVGDYWGRRKSLIGAVTAFNFGVIFQVCAQAIPMLVAGRFIAGVGVGTISVLVPIYQAEMAPKWIRGTLVCFYQLSITIGLLTASIVNMLTAGIDGAAAYQIPLGLQFTWAVVLSLGLLVLPETPRYLIKRGLKDAAAVSLSRLRRLDRLHPALLEELAEIEANHEYELALGPATYKDVVFGTPHLGRRTLTGCGLQMLQQLTGVNFIMYYGTTFFVGAGIQNAFLVSLIINIVNTISTIPALFIIEAWGRRKVLIYGAVAMAICQLLIASFSAAVGNSMPTTANQILIIFLCIDIFFFAASWGPVAWVITSEIYPLKVRAKSMSISTASNWLLNFGISYGSPYMVEEGAGYADMGTRVFFVWGAFCAVAAVFVWAMVYETSKISLEQIDEMYERVAFAWHSAHFEPSWSFQQMRDLGYSDSGVPTQEQELEPTTTHQSDTVSSSSVTGDNSSSTDENKAVSQLGHVDFSY
ncbi:putative glucose transporter rco-3 [Diaporthe ampelina]|uniref:Putative glucose transporter rco-3 n=1 Tax=Diaporthe ampelina TaxID=1214573 RepID=A0A0G2ICR1_9PEZI|nr:putative glucose transporter rco-3 [Diaporthe ampelina]